MNWNIVIYVVVVLQLIAFTVLGIFLLKLWKGPISRFIRRGVKLARLGTRLGQSSATIFGRNLRKGEEIVQEVKGIAEGVKQGTRTDFGDEISYRSLLALWGSFRNVLGTTMGVLVFLSGLRKKKDVTPPGSTGAPTKPARLPRRSLANRMGLVPPIAQPLGRLYNYGRMAWDIRNELKRRGISPF